MYFHKGTMMYTQDYSNEIERIKIAINEADAILIGAGAGLSTSAGFFYTGERFKKYFSDYEEKYNIHDMYSLGFYPYDTKEEKWAFWSRYVYINRYQNPPKPVYDMLLNLVKDKDYFVLTTNVDHCFQKSGFEKTKMFYTQGDYGLFQCSLPCHQNTYDNEEQIKQMYAKQSNMRIPTELIPTCPVCGREMSMNLRSDETFVEDEGWHAANKRYAEFVEKYKDKKLVLLELGVGGNTPVIIKYPFWRMTFNNKKATYICINCGEAMCPDQIKAQSVCIDADIAEILKELS